MLISILSFVFVLGILIFIHELGHFLVAKKVGVRVEKFSLGFPPNIFSKQFGETTYCIGIIPLGGFVKMAGENPDEKVTGDPGEFMSKTVGQRAAVIFAGPFMNYVLAIALLVGIFFLTGTALTDDNQVIVGEIAADSPAENAGLKIDDKIISINGEHITSFDSLRIRINAALEDTVNLVWVRNSDTISAPIVTMIQEIPNLDGSIDSVGIIGFNQKIIGYEKHGFIDSAKRGFVTTHIIVWETVKFVKRIVTGQVSSKLIGGPLFIAQQSGKEAKKGAANLFFFMALLSVNLAVLNVLPIPILDGGHLVFLALEKVKGSPLSLRARMIAQQIGFVLLLGIIIIVTYNDIVRAIKGF